MRRGVLMGFPEAFEARRKAREQTLAVMALVTTLFLGLHALSQVEKQTRRLYGSASS